MLDAMREGGWTAPLTIAAVVGLAPLAEEVFFRRYAFAHLRRHVPGWLAYGASAALFAGVHLNPAAVASYLLYGLLLAVAWDRTRSLTVVVLAHATVNATAVATHLMAGWG